MPPMPAGCGPLWDAFQQISASRQAGMGGVSGISQSELQAWQANNQVELTPWEIATLLALDAVALRQIAEQQQAKKT